MDPKIIEFLKSHRISVFTTVRKDGSLHSAALHYSHNDNPFEFYFSTENTSRKCEALIDGTAQKASVVIGFSEEEWLTLQLEGSAQVVLDPAEIAAVQSVHYQKYPASAKYKDDPTSVFIKFTPTWWRYTDFNASPLLKITSEQ